MSDVTLVDFLCRNSTHDGADPQKRPPPWQPNARPSSMAMVSRAARAWQPCHDGLFDVAYEGFFSNTLTD